MLIFIVVVVVAAAAAGFGLETGLQGALLGQKSRYAQKLIDALSGQMECLSQNWGIYFQ